MSLKDRLRLWLDFSATAKDQNGTYYSWIISDYQLAARLNYLQLAGRPIRITKKMVDDTIATFEGILERAPLETRSPR